MTEQSSQAAERTAPPLAFDLEALLNSVESFPEGLTALKARKNRFAAAAAIPRLRDEIEKAIDQITYRSIRNLKREPVVIIGGGLHAAIFAATYYRETGRQPLVLESGGRLGGVFGLCRKPFFYLNSRNRPERGDIRGPGTAGPLNSIGGSFELSDISGLEYPTQDDLAYVIRCTLAQYARPITGARVYALNLDRGKCLVSVMQGANVRKFRAKAVILATGIGFSRPLGTLTFEALLGRVDRDPFMLRRLGQRIAVIGAGDSGSCVVEYLLGQGPPNKFETVSTAFPDRISWFGQECRTREEFMEGARSRYAGIGRYMPRLNDPDYYARVIPYPRAVTYNDVTVRYRDEVETVRTSGPYDSIIVCSGEREQDDAIRLDGSLSLRGESPFKVGDLVCGTCYDGTAIYKVGPCAELPVSDTETEENTILAQVPQNSVALFRYNRRTQLVARALA